VVFSEFVYVRESYSNSGNAESWLLTESSWSWTVVMLNPGCWLKVHGPGQWWCWVLVA